MPQHLVVVEGYDVGAYNIYDQHGISCINYSIALGGSLLEIHTEVAYKLHTNCAIYVQLLCHLHSRGMKIIQNLWTFHIKIVCKQVQIGSQMLFKHKLTSTCISVIATQ